MYPECGAISFHDQVPACHLAEEHDGSHCGILDSGEHLCWWEYGKGFIAKMIAPICPGEY